MKSKDRFVFDTNVMVRAVLIGNSYSAEAFHKARHDLLVLHPFRGIPILSVDQFLASH